MVYLDLLLVGFGNVGRQFARLLQEKSVQLRRDYGLSWRVVGIATKRHGSAFDARGLDIVKALRLAEAGTSLDVLTGAESERLLPADASGLDLIKYATSESKLRRLQHLVLVETTLLDIQRGQPAVDHVITALRGGAHVVTANKGPVAFAHREIRSVAELAHREFLFEGAVMDGIPVFNLVRETLPVADITGFRGVVNATTNYILTAMEAGRTFAEALAEMQGAGIAEADPSFDVDGWDAAAKTAALMNVLMHGSATPRTIARTGIREITRDRVEDAMARGKRIRLVAAAERGDGHPVGHVAPEELDADDPLAHLTGMQNLLILQTDVLGSIGIHQLDGGLTQTAYALVSDLAAIARRVGRDSS
ncbi:MAG: homoserine dehydrogenase [Acidobacteria bacterium]|nr:homoserine dehydrogenase [Acidobacteriota bacterium]